MSSLRRTTTVVILCTAIAAAVGGWLGVRYGLRAVDTEQRLDQMLHSELHLSSEQERRIASLEASFAARRSALEGQMRAANRDLAQAIAVRHSYDAEARRAMDRLHAAMMELQEASIEHVLAMRAVLTPLQAEQFDRTVTKVLATGAS